MKKLVVFYSFEGNTRFIAENIAQEIDADLLELRPKKDVKSKGFMKYFWGGRQVVMKATPKLESFDVNPQDYDILFIGTPVWAFSYAPALKSFFEKIHLADKKIAIFCCCQGIKGRALEKMKESLKKNEIIGQIDFIDPLKIKQASVLKAREWAKKLLKILWRIE